MGTLTNSEDPDETNSEDPDEMLHIMLHFISVYTVCKD